MPGGRPKGSINLQSKMLKEMAFEALDMAGGAKYLYEQSQNNPAAFMTMLGKLLPTQITGDDENPLAVTHSLMVAIVPNSNTNT